MEYLLHRVGGRPASQRVELRRCTPAEAQAVFELQNEVYAGMTHREWFVPDTLENYARYLREDLCIGAWQGSRLGAYFVLRCCGTQPDNYAAFLGVPPAEWPQWANADSAVVHPDWQGNGLQRAMLQAALPLLPPQIKTLAATICPDNPYSLNNALASGFRVVCRREMYGGFDRYLLRRDL